MTRFAEKTVLVLGLGASGLAMARWCHTQGAQVVVADTREAPPQLAALQSDCPGARFIAGTFGESLINELQPAAVFKSPGLSPASVAVLREAAQQRGLLWGGELSLFALALADLADARQYQPKVLAITGTNGKTTVTSLTGQLVERCGQTVAVAGNIGPTLLDTLAEHLVADTLPQAWVLELSSFQLDDVNGPGLVPFNPTAGVVLNLTQDHLDWHADMADYASAKAKVFGGTGVMVLNRDDAAVAAMQPTPVKGQAPRSVVCFGDGLPTRPGDYGLETVNGMTWLVRAHEADETRKKRAPKNQPNEPEEIFVQRLMPADALRIRGRHNALNALAALALVSSANLPLAPALFALREYRGESHRVESIGVVNDVDYIDDSKGTNVGATVAAITGLGAQHAPHKKLWVILGGEGKGQDFSPLAAPVAQHVRGVLLIGRDAPLIRSALEATGVDCVDATDLPHAVALASSKAQTGEVVLLSPACASFDMFRDYEHRAQVFREAVAQLAADRGQSLEASAG